MRYFFFSYRVINPIKSAYGNLSLERETFPSNSELRQIAEKRSGFSGALVTGWQEFKTKEDFENFIKN